MLNDTNNNLEQVYARINDPNYLLVTSLSDLFEMSITPHRQIIEDCLTVGLYMLVGPPKYGKSFISAQIAVHVATGVALWGRSVTEGTVLYLALEDTYERLQRRLYRMFGLFETKNLYFALTVNKDGLEAQLSQFINNHPDTVLVIIDTLARVRNNQKAQSYLNDYEEITKIKAFADEHDIAILLVHHTRKQKASDSYEMISGTTGILGALDGAILMLKNERTNCEAILQITGRDYPDQLIQVRRDPNTLCWSLVKEKRDIWQPEPDPILDAISELLHGGNEQWFGSPQDLVIALSLDIHPNRLTRHLNACAQRLLDDHQVLYTNRPRHEGRRITLTYCPKTSNNSNDSDDSNDCVR